MVTASRKMRPVSRLPPNRTPNLPHESAAHGQVRDNVRAMEMNLSIHELRVLGSLIEKSVTTPDYYPLTLSALVSACNQKSSREPVLNLSETEVMVAVESLTAKNLASEKTPHGSRVTKYAHRLSNTLGLTYEFSRNELGTLCVLMLRGAQTVGEIRSRTARLCEFDSLQHVEETLNILAEREDGPFVRRLEKQVGRKEWRYTHLLGDRDSVPSVVPTTPRIDSGHEISLVDRLASLEAKVAGLQEQVDSLRIRDDETR